MSEQEPLLNQISVLKFLLEIIVDCPAQMCASAVKVNLGA